jgi:SAM-dependent methyltransferase
MTTTDPMGIGTTEPGVIERIFRRRVDRGRTRTPRPRVLELGTRRSEEDRPTHHRHWFPEAHFVMSDFQDGLDVDVVTDAHDLAAFQTHQFDAVIAVSVFEHLARPWLAAEAIARVLRPGGMVLVSTHQTFPIHGYPDDYWRFTDSAMGVLFGPPLWRDLHTAYRYPCVIQPPAEVTRWNEEAPSYLNIEAVATRTAMGLL